jgi:hypothetical protein
LTLSHTPMKQLMGFSNISLTYPSMVDMANWNRCCAYLEIATTTRRATKTLPPEWHSDRRRSGSVVLGLRAIRILYRIDSCHGVREDRDKDFKEES